MSSLENKAGAASSKNSKFEQQNNFRKENLSDNAKKCFRRILVLINYRERCCEELYQRLVIREKFSYDDFKLALAKAKKYDLVNDERYAEMYAFTKLESNRGIDGIVRHLKLMKIDYKSMPKLINMISEYKDSELFRAKEYIKNHPTRSKNKFSGNVRKLINRGYSASIAIKASSSN